MSKSSSPDATAAARGTVALGITQTVTRLMGLLFVVAVAHALVPDEFGRYSTVTAFVVMGSLIADFGTTPVLARHISRQPEDAKPLLGGTLVLSFILGLAVYGGLLALAAIGSFPPEALPDIALGALAVPVGSALGSLMGVLDGRRLTAQRSLATFIQSLVVSAGGALTIAMGGGIRLAIMAIPLGSLAAILVGSVIAFRTGIWQSPLKIDIGRSAWLLKSAVPYAVLGLISAFALRFDVILLSLLTNRTETAQYDVALRFIEGISYIATVIAVPSLVIFSHRLGRGETEGANRAFQEAARILYLLGLPISVGLAALSAPAVAILYGSGYEGARVPLAILALQTWLAFLGGLHGSLIMAGDHVPKALKVSAAITSVTVLLDLLLIGRFGAIGAASATAGAQVVAVFAFARFNFRLYGISTPLPPLGAVVGSVVSAAIALLVLPISLLLAIFAGAFAYSITVLMTRTATLQDARRALALLRGR